MADKVTEELENKVCTDLQLSDNSKQQGPTPFHPPLQYKNFKACFGGEELKRACATLSGALVGGKSKVCRGI